MEQREGRGSVGSEGRASAGGAEGGAASALSTALPSVGGERVRSRSGSRTAASAPPPSTLSALSPSPPGTAMKFVDLRATYDLELVQRFYDEIIMANFPVEDERDDLDWFQNGLLPANPEYLDPKDPLLYVVIAMAPPPRSPDERYTFENCGSREVDKSWLMAGAIAFEYFKKSNCGLVTYIVTQPLFNRKGIARRLMELAHEKLNQAASTMYPGWQCSAIFAETHALDVRDGIMDSAARHAALQKLGFSQIVFPYVQPPILHPDGNDVRGLLLLVYNPHERPASAYETAHAGALDCERHFASSLLRTFFHEFCSACAWHMSEKFERRPFYLDAMELLDSHWAFEIRREGPWLRATPDSVMSPSERVVVIGGGLAGLAAAAALLEHGFLVTLVEASKELGGRLRQARVRGWDQPVDVGADLVFGEFSFPMEIARDLGVATHLAFRTGDTDGVVLPGEQAGQVFVHCDGTLVDIREFNKMEDIDYLKHVLFEDHPDLDELQGDNDMTLLEYLTERNVTQRALAYAEARYAQAYNGELTYVGLREFLLQWKAHRSYGGDNYYCGEALASLLVRHYKENIEDADVRLSWPVSKVTVRSAIASDPSVATEIFSLSAGEEGEEDLTPEPSLLSSVERFLTLPGAPAAFGVARLCLQGAEWLAQTLPKMLRNEPRFDVCEEDAVPECETPFGDSLLPAVSVANQRGDIIDADYIVVTVPLPILKDGDIEFEPPLVESKQQALESLQLDSALKVICVFDHRVWPSDCSAVWCSSQEFSKVWFKPPSASGPRRYVAIGVANGSLARSKSFVADDEIIRRFLRQLEAVFGSSSSVTFSRAFVNGVVYRWDSNPFIRGGSSYPQPSGPESRAALATPSYGRLFFAGEAVHADFPGSVQAAIETGVRAAQEVCDTSARLRGQMLNSSLMCSPDTKR